ncbi:MAG: peptidoglycan-binding domain-containing protein [Christensenellales bacterium]
MLRVGSTGSDVSDLQARLTELGYYTGTIDGKYSTGTQSAVTEFQSRNGLTADGIAGRATQDKLYSASAQPKTVSASAVTAATRCSRRARLASRCASCRGGWPSWAITRAAWTAFTARRRPARSRPSSGRTA